MAIDFVTLALAVAAVVLAAAIGVAGVYLVISAHNRRTARRLAEGRDVVTIDDAQNAIQFGDRLVAVLALHDSAGNNIRSHATDVYGGVYLSVFWADLSREGNPEMVAVFQMHEGRIDFVGLHGQPEGDAWLWRVGDPTAGNLAAGWVGVIKNELSWFLHDCPG
jgi:hypothetical protein